MADSVEAVPLNTEMLGRLQELWTAKGSDVSRRLAPGASVTGIDELLEAQGLVAPEELRIWWSWHDGAQLNADHRVALAPGRSILSLREALERRAIMMAVAEDASAAWDVAPEELWGRGWLPFVRGENDFLVCNCTPAGGSLAPVRWVANHEMTPDELNQVRLPSVGALVQLWTYCLEGDYWRYEPETRLWVYDNWEQIPEALRVTGAFR